MAHGWWEILLLLLPSALYWPLVRKIIKEIPVPGRKQLLAAASAFVVITLFGTLLILNDRKGASNPRRLYLSEFSQDSSLRTFGLVPTMGLDLRMNVLGLKWDEKVNVDGHDDPCADGNSGPDTGPDEGTGRNPDTYPGAYTDADAVSEECSGYRF